VTVETSHKTTDAPTAERALRAIRDLRMQLDALEARQTEPIAIVGMACRFPGAENLQAFWDMLIAGTDPLGEVPAERWDIDAYYNPSLQAPGKTVTREGGYLPDLDKFDAAFFGISPREAPYIDPRQRLVLETSWEALEDAGIPPRSLARSRTSVVVGTLTNDYNQLITADPRWVSASTGTGTSNSIIANRVSYLLDLNGPSLTVDTACAGSLLAIHLACQTLRNGEANLALCGGVAVNLVPAPDICFSRMGALSPSGRCRAFDRSSDGMVRSEGAGMIVLKPLSQALADRDRIYAVLRGSVTNHDGRSNGIAAPNGRAQEALLREAYEKTGVSPGLVQYVEAHGTGTILGDQIEIQALSSVLATNRTAGRPCVIGSVKSNIGHTESAAGVAGVIKTALALKHRVLPGNLHVREPHPALAEADFPLRVQRSTGPFPLPNEKIIAGVSSFSFGGANVHVVLEEPPQPEDRKAPDKAAAVQNSRDLFVLPLSAASESALRALAVSYKALLSNPTGPDLRDICYTAGLRRTHHERRIAVIGRTRDELAAALQAYVTHEESPALITEQGIADDKPAKLAFVFSGQGSHWQGMGRDLYRSENAFRDAIDRCEPIFVEEAGWSLIGELLAEPHAAHLDAIDVVQPLIFAVQVGLAEVLRSWKIAPAVVCGQSMGEVAAAYFSGALDLADAVKVIVARSRLLLSKRGVGATAVVGLPAEQVEAALTGRDAGFGVAGATSFTSCIVSGEAGSVKAFLKDLQRQDVFCRLLENVDVPAHSPAMDSLKPLLVQELADLRPREAAIPFISTVTVAAEHGAGLDASYWARNLREPFRVSETLAQIARDGANIFLEISPHPVVTGAVRQCLSHIGAHGVAIGSLTREGDSLLELRKVFASLYVQGYPVPWEVLHPDAGRCVSLPTYPWQREHFWVDQIGASFPAATHSQVAGCHPLLGMDRQVAQTGAHVWETTLDSYTLPWLQDHGIRSTAILPGAAYLEMAVAAGREALSWDAITIKSATFERMLLLAEPNGRQVQTILTRSGRDDARVTIYSRSAGEGSEWTLHAGMEITRVAREEPATVNIGELHKLYNDEVSLPDFYGALKEKGLEYGPSFQGLVNLRRGNGGALAEIVLREQAGSARGAYALPPALLDAAFQAVATISNENGAPDAVYLPHSVRDMAVHHDLPEKMWCRATLAPGAEPGAQTLNAALTLFRSDGQPVAEIGCLTFKRLDEVKPEIGYTVEGSLYRIAWESLPRKEAPRSGAATAPWLIMVDESGFGNAVLAALRACGETGILVPAGIRRDELEGKLAECEPRGVIFLHGLDAGAAPADARHAARDTVCANALKVVQALAARQGQSETPLWLVTRGAVSCGTETNEPAVMQAPLWGFGRVLAAEHPDLWGGLIDLDPEGGGEQADLLITEILAPDAERQIAFRGGERRGVRLVRARHEFESGAHVAMRPDGAYLITGGLTGLGLETAFWMARQGARRLILLGRTVLPPRAGWNSVDPTGAMGLRIAAIRELEALGTNVQTVGLDVGDVEGLAAFFESYRRENLPPIRGIVHAAGLIQDSLLLNLGSADFDAVMKPKVAGSWALHRLTSGMSLDFFVLYSSASAIFGQTGQANYAAANAFQDALAWLRRKQGLPATVIDWGPWSEAGLFARLGLAERAGLAGVKGIGSAQGLQILERVLSSGAVQTIALDADWSQIAPSPFLVHVQASDSAADALGSEQDLSLLNLLLLNADERKVVLKERLVETVAAVMRFDAARIDLHKPLTALGMDSIMAVELRNRIRRQFQITLPMVDLFTGSIMKLTDKIDMTLSENEHFAKMLEEIENLPDEVITALLGTEPTVA